MSEQTWKDIHWELVTDFGSLRAGDYCAVSPCRWCGGRHEFMLLRFEPNHTALNPDGTISGGPKWLESRAPCSDRVAKEMWLTPTAVARRAIYRASIPPVLDDVIHYKRKLVKQ